MTMEDLNDRLVDSPKAPGYAPLLTKKLTSASHNSSENVLGASNSATAPANRQHYQQRQASMNNHARQRIASPALLVNTNGGHFQQMSGQAQ